MTASDARVLRDCNHLGCRWLWVQHTVRLALLYIYKGACISLYNKLDTSESNSNCEQHTIIEVALQNPQIRRNWVRQNHRSWEQRWGASDHGALISNLVLSRSLLQRSGAPGRDKEIRHKIYSCFIERPAKIVVDWTDFNGEQFRSIEGRWAVSDTGSV